MELAGVAVVFGEGGGELVGAVHGGAGAEIEVAVAVRVQDGFKTGFVRHTDRAGRKALMKVGVVRRIELQMLEQDPVQSVATITDSATFEYPPSAANLGLVYVWKLSPGVSEKHERLIQSFQSALIASFCFCR